MTYIANKYKHIEKKNCLNKRAANYDTYRKCEYIFHRLLDATFVFRKWPILSLSSRKKKTLDIDFSISYPISVLGGSFDSRSIHDQLVIQLLVHRVINHDGGAG